MASVADYVEEAGLIQAELVERVKRNGGRAAERQISRAVAKGELRYVGKGRPGPNRKLVRA